MDTMAEITLEITLFGNPVPPKEISRHIGITATKALLKIYGLFLQKEEMMLKKNGIT